MNILKKEVILSVLLLALLVSLFYSAQFPTGRATHQETRYARILACLSDENIPLNTCRLREVISQAEFEALDAQPVDKVDNEPARTDAPPNLDDAPPNPDPPNQDMPNVPEICGGENQACCADKRCERLIDPALVGHWSEIIEGKLHDATGKSEGDIVGTVQAVVDPDLGPALVFDGKSHVSLGEKPSFDLSGPLTLSVWFKSSDTNSAGLIGKYDPAGTGTGDNGYLLWLSDGAVTFTLAKLNDYLSASTTKQFTDGKPHHVVAVATAEPDLVRVYVDGVKQDLAFAGRNYEKLTSIGPTDAGYPFIIGRYTTGMRPFKGVLADARLYSRSLSEHEITNLHTRQPEPYVCDEKINKCVIRLNAEP